jgi:hypothetical protein
VRILIVGVWVGGGDDVLAGLDLDGAVAAGRLDEFPDGPAGLRFDPAADGERCEDDRQVGFDGFWPAPALCPPVRG